MAQPIVEWIMSCQRCNKESRIDRSLTPRPLQKPNEHITAPEDAMQIDLVPELPPSGVYEIIVKAIDVFSRFLFAYSTSNKDAKTIAKAVLNIITKHAYLPTTLISDAVSALVSHVIKEVAGVLGVSLKLANTKHAQTIGVLEQSQLSIKQALKIETGERRSLWHKYVSIVVPNFNTSYHNYLGLKIGKSSTATKHLHFANCPRCSWPNGEGLPRCWQICYLRLHQIQSLFRQKSSMQSSKRQITYMSYTRKRIIKRVEICLRNFGGLAPTFLKRCYLITSTWYATLAPTRHKCFIANPHPTYESHHNNGYLIRKWALNTMFCMPERGSVNTKSQFLTPKTIIQRHPFPPKFKNKLIYYPRKRGTHQERHRSVPEKFSLKDKNFVTKQRNRYVSLQGTCCGNKLGTTEH